MSLNNNFALNVRHQNHQVQEMSPIKKKYIQNVIYDSSPDLSSVSFCANIYVLREIYETRET